MQVRISANPHGPLSVIDRLPDARLAILEGYNGIGKTLAVRILQLCTGTMPYPEGSPAWQSLREGLGAIEVEITGLQGADSVVWVADSADWEPGEDPGPRADWFKSIMVDGEPASLDDMRRLITVIRLAGNEELTDTFASQADAHAAIVQRWRVKHAASEQGPLKQLEDLAGAAEDTLSSVSIATLAQLKFEADDAKREHADTKGAVGELQTRRDQINRALDMQRRVTEMHTKAPELRRELTEIDQLIVKTESELEAAQEAVAALSAQAGRSEPWERELEKAERTLDRNIRNLTETWNSAAEQAAALDIEDDADAARELLDELTQLEEQLSKQHQEQYQAPAMMQLLGTVTEELGTAESRGLGDQVAVDHADSDRLLTVSQTRAGMVTRRGFLKEQPPPARAVEIAQELKRVTDRKDGVKSLLATFKALERYARLVGENEDRVLTALQEGAGGEAAQALDRANKRRSECNQALLALAAKRAAVAQKLGTSGSGTSQQALTGQLNDVLESLKVPEEHLEAESSRIDEQCAQAEAELAEANVRARACQKQLTKERDKIREAVKLLNSDASLSWVRESLNRHQPTVSGSIDQLHRDLLAAQNLVKGVLDRLGDHRNQLSAIEGALQGTARELRGQRVDASVYVDEIQAWLASSFSGWFNDHRVRGELLPNADKDQQVTVDLGTKRVSWSENQTRRSRPLEAFSSGEQAFAYTRARLAVLDDPDRTVSDRLIVLDEFGAFIARHLMQGMLNYLKEWTSDRQSDCVLLILPLSRDYSQMAKGAIGGRAKRFSALADHVKAHGYVSRPIVR